MADGFAWTADPAWAGLLPAGRTGRSGEAPGLTVAAREGLALATLIAGAGDEAALARAIAARFGLDLPATPRLASGHDVTALWSGPGQWLAISASPGLAARLRDAAGGFAAIADQTGSRAILRLTGPHLRDALGKGCMIDLHPDAFPVGAVALTSVAHLGIQIWRPDEGAFEIAVSRSYAGSLWSWLAGAAAEYGCEVAGG